MKRGLGQWIALLCGFGIALASVFYQAPSSISGVREWLRILSNAALLPGVLFVGLSAMVWIAGDGLFDGVRYTMSSLLAQLRGAEKEYASYYDYLQREKKKNTAYPMLIPGLCFLAAAVLLTLLYYCG